MLNVAEEVKTVRKTLPRAILATLVSTVVIYVAVTLLSTLLASGFPIAQLAEATSATTLAVFAPANLALVRIKRREPRVEGAPCVPLLVPIVGILVSAGFLVFELGYRLLG